MACASASRSTRVSAGDILITNLPSLNGSHAQDFILIEPVFLDGEPIAFIAVRGHMGDTGGDGFSMSSTTEIFQEGLLIPR